MRILFFGSSDFSLTFLEWLASNSAHTLLGVVTLAAAPRGRGLQVTSNSVETFAIKNEYPVFVPENLKDPKVIEQLSALKPEMLLVASYGKYLPKAILDLSELPLNIHPSLLPKYRGPNPILAPLLHGDAKTGVSLMKISEKMDAGDIYKQSVLDIGPKMTGGELAAKLAQLGIILLEAFFRDIEAGNVRFYPQNESEATKTEKTKKDDTEFSWMEPVENIDRKIRAFLPKPRAFFQFRSKRVFVEDGEVISVEALGQGPKLEGWDLESGAIDLVLPEGRYSLRRVMPEGRRSITAYEFAQGQRLKKGDIFQ